MKENIQKYLAKYAEKEITLTEKITTSYDQVIIIPAYGEYDEIKDLLISNLVELAKKNKFILILVINCKKNSSEVVKNNNHKLLDFLINEPNYTKTDYFVNFENYDIFIVNRSSEGLFFDDKQGVGLARKIGCDVALKLFYDAKIKSPWLRCTDGDVFLPDNYFEISPETKKFSCITYDFYHDFITDDNQGKSLLLYEIYLRYYLLGLEYANSVYNFHTIGSCMAISVEGYSQVRGFSDSKEAGEDFYMLNKLSKIKPVFKAKTSTITIRCRKSDRVPFGTGASMNKISHILDQHNDYLVYDPKCFEALKKFYDMLYEIDSLKDLEKISKYEKEVFFIVLSQMGFKEAIVKFLKISSNEHVFMRHLHTWFDAFRTLKFIHQLTNDFYPLIPLKKALEKASFINLDLSKNITDIRDEVHRLEKNTLIY